MGFLGLNCPQVAPWLMAAPETVPVLSPAILMVVDKPKKDSRYGSLRDYGKDG